jgi:hypothetical protein
VRHCFVIDTNVIYVANGWADQASESCRRACIDFLESIKDGRAPIVIDTGGSILSEYLSARSRAQPGVGDRFVQWVINVQGDDDRCERVSIRTSNNDRAWEEFPADPSLFGFHWDEQKFVTVALTSERRPTIVNAVDSDWAQYADALRSTGVDILCLCPDIVAC